MNALENMGEKAIGVDEIDATRALGQSIESRNRAATSGAEV